MQSFFAKLAAPFRLGRDWLAGGDVADPESKVVATFLVGAFTLVAGALAVIGLGEGDVDRGVVTYPGWALLAFLLIVVAVCLGSLMSLTKRSRPRGVIGVLGLFALGIGLYVLAAAAINGRIARDRPRLDAHIERTPTGLRVKGTVAAEGLTNKQHVFLRVIGISTRNRLAEAHIGHRRGTERVSECALGDLLYGKDLHPDTGLVQTKPASFQNGTPQPARRDCWRQLAYSSRTGAGTDGKVAIAIDTPIATGVYERIDVEAQTVDDPPGEEEQEKDETSAATDAEAQEQQKSDDAEQAKAQQKGLKNPRCDKNGGDFACVTLMIPPSSRRPELDAKWKLPASNPPVLAITARMGDLSIDDRVLLSVIRMRGEKKGGRIYGASWAPSALGEVNQKLEIPVAAKRRKLCVILRTLRGSILEHPEKIEQSGPCQPPRSRGMSVQLYPPPRKG